MYAECKMKKQWYKSKTVGFGAALGVLGLAILALPEFQAVINTLPAEYTGYATLGIALVTVILRFVTGQPIR